MTEILIQYQPFNTWNAETFQLFYWALAMSILFAVCAAGDWAVQTWRSR